MTELLPVTKTFKKYRKRGVHNGMTLEQVYELELEIYNLLNNYKNFPKLLSWDNINFTITIENCGQSLHKLRQHEKSEIVVTNLDEQVDNICQALKVNNITYLDLDPQNICYKNKNIFLIDFDKAVVNQKPKSDFLERIYLDFIHNVSDESFQKTLKEFVVNPNWQRYQFVQ
jgi:tRNA A-37 threonylcarbamoyl transferase component Bud32